MRRPPFIWTPQQPINPQGFLAVMGDAPRRDDGANRWFLFRHRFAKPESETTTRVTCDGRYRLWINGKAIGRGPVRSSAMSLKYDSYDIASALVDGPNIAAVLVHAIGVDTAWYETVKGMWQPTFGNGGLWLDGAITSHGHWLCCESEAWSRSTERMNSGLGFIESFDARRLPPDWTDAAFDDSGWHIARSLRVDGGGPDQFFGGIDVVPHPILTANPLPPQFEEEHPLVVPLFAGIVAARPDLPLHRQAYEEPVVRTIPLPTLPCRLSTAPDEGVILLFKFDILLSGYPFVVFDAQGGEEIDIAVAESLPGEYVDGIAEPPRIVPSPMLGHDAHLARTIARPGPQRFERFEWSAVRWMQVTIRHAPKGLVLKEVGVVMTHYPVDHGGDFCSSDPHLDRLWRLGRETLTLCMHDGWEDCPSREQRQWLGDVTVEHAAAQAAFGPSANALTAKYLCDVADSQRPDGLTQMFAPGDHRTDGLLIPDWTLQWILTAGDYYRYTGDLDTIEAIYPAIQRALAWFEALRTSNGLIADLPYWHFIDWAAVGRRGEAATLNAQLAGTLATATMLAEALGYARAATRYRDARQAIVRALNTRHWDARRGIYVDCVDPDTGTQDLRVSQHANAAMILWGDAPAERWPSMIERITDPARLTFTAAPPIAPHGDPLDLEHGVVLANTFYSHFVYAALAKAGHVDRMLAMMRNRYGPMLDAGAVTLWESFAPTASLCHGFSASPTYQLITHVLGISPALPGFARLQFAPDLGGLKRAEGRIATVAGPVTVTLAAHGDAIDAEIDLPAGLDADVIPLTPGTPEQRLIGGNRHRIRIERARP